MALAGRLPWYRSVKRWLKRHLLVGNLLCGVLGAVAGYFMVQGLWRWYVVRQVDARRRRPQRRAVAGISLPSSSRQT